MCPEVEPECFTGGNKVFQKQIFDFVSNEEHNKAQNMLNEVNEIVIREQFTTLSQAQYLINK
jgi:hypothetical protein